MKLMILEERRKIRYFEEIKPSSAQETFNNKKENVKLKSCFLNVSRLKIVTYFLLRKLLEVRHTILTVVLQTKLYQSGSLT